MADSNGHANAHHPNASPLTLPIAEARQELISLIKSNKTLVLVGETGSGKSTQLPQFVLKAGLAQVML